MLMTQSPILRHKTALVEALRSLGSGWHTRNEIAEQLGKNALSPIELTVLAELVARGEIIDGELAQGARLNTLRWHYRIKDE